MSIQARSEIYLRCDTTVSDNQDGQCFVTFGRDPGYPDGYDGIELLARRARDAGWRAEPKYLGLVGWQIDATCPDHVTGEAPDAA